MNKQYPNKSKMEHENLNTPQNPPLQQTAVVCSAYYVHIAGQGETCVVAENIADAMDKIENLTEANYTFIFNRSLPCII